MNSLSSQRDRILALMEELRSAGDQDQVETLLKSSFAEAPDEVQADDESYFSTLNLQLYRYAIKHYKQGEERMTLWRFCKNIAEKELACRFTPGSALEMTDALVRVFFYSDPLDDLTGIFIPIEDRRKIGDYLNWIKFYFYEANYPTSLLWLYALDSSVSDFFPDEIVFFGRGRPAAPEKPNIILPDFDYADSVFFKRFSDAPGHYTVQQGRDANLEFQQIFNLLEEEYRDRCLSRSGKKTEGEGLSDRAEWEKFAEVLEYGVSDKYETGCISFSDLRSSTSFLNAYGKETFRNKIQQPFFENTKMISKQFEGRIDKFMGDNVMCSFLTRDDRPAEAEENRVMLNNFCALVNLSRLLHDLMTEQGLSGSSLGLRSGVSFGTAILRSNLGNEIVRDFTVTGETVNFAARLEHFSIHELVLHNRSYFQDSIERFQEISSLIAAAHGEENLNEETRNLVRDYTLFQNIISNLEKLDRVRYDIRCNNAFYVRLRAHLEARGFRIQNADKAGIFGYDRYEIGGVELEFYYSFFNPKGFDAYEKIWILPLYPETLTGLDLEKLK